MMVLLAILASCALLQQRLGIRMHVGENPDRYCWLLICGSCSVLYLNCSDVKSISIKLLSFLADPAFKTIDMLLNARNTALTFINPVGASFSIAIVPGRIVFFS